MNLQRVTITGADDSIEPEALAELSAKYPFVEWGILFSVSHQGRAPRYPTHEWIARLPHGPNYCAHLCGAYVRGIVIEGNVGMLAVFERRVPEFKRIQLNFHGQFHKAHLQLSKRLLAASKREFIFQCDGANDPTVVALCADEPQFLPLFDTSGGAGVLPERWPLAWPGTYCGYAGGLGPENVVEELRHISEVSGAPFWIDMESRVRSTDDRQFDLAKVERVLAACEPFIQV